MKLQHMRESVTVVLPYIHGGLVSGPPKVTKIRRCSCRLQLVLCVHRDEEPVGVEGLPVL